MERPAESVLELARKGERDAATRLVRDRLFEVRRGTRDVAGEEALELGQAASVLGLLAACRASGVL